MNKQVEMASAAQKKGAVLEKEHGRFTHISKRKGRVDEHRCRWVEEVVVVPMELLFYFLKLGRGC